MGVAMEPIGIKELIDRVKQELLAEHDVSQPLFVIGQVEVEVSFTVERNVSGGIDLQVVQIGGERRVSEAHTVRVVLEPLAKGADVAAKLTQEQKLKATKAVMRGTTRGGDSTQTTK